MIIILRPRLIGTFYLVSQRLLIPRYGWAYVYLRFDTQFLRCWDDRGKEPFFCITFAFLTALTSLIYRSLIIDERPKDTARTTIRTEPPSRPLPVFLCHLDCVQMSSGESVGGTIESLVCVSSIV